MGDMPVAAQDDRERQSSETIAQRFRNVDRFVAADQRRVVEVELAGECDHFIALINGDAYKLHAMRSEFALSTDEFGHLFAAGFAPSSPKVDDEHLALPLAQRLLRPLRVRQRKRKQRTCVRRLAIPDGDPDAKGQRDDSQDHRDDQVAHTVRHLGRADYAGRAQWNQVCFGTWPGTTGTMLAVGNASTTRCTVGG
jgi:hypothetical protein